MDTILHSVLPFLGILIGLIVVHEIGHFVTAKMSGVKVLEAGIGYPPRLWGFKRGETEYTINALPLGGFVRMLGEEDPSDPRSLAAKPRWIRLVVLGSGAFMNLVVAVLLFSMALMIPREVDISHAVVVDVVPGGPAAEAGLRPGDLIMAVNGRDIQNIGELGYRIRLNLGSTMDFTVRRTEGGSAELVEVPVYARWSAPSYVDEDGNEQEQGPTGITIGPYYLGNPVPLTPEERAKIAKELEPGEEVPLSRRIPLSETQSMPFWEAFPAGFRRGPEAVVLTVKEFISRAKGGVAGGGEGGVRGPVGIAQLTGTVVEEAGWKSLMDFAALISMNLGVINILPLPMLDGGRIVFVLLEFLRGGRRIAPEREALVHFVGLVAILAFAVVITYFDVVRIFAG